MTSFLHSADVIAFDEIYHQYHHAVFKNIRRLIDQHDIAEDILQEVFLAFWNSRHQLDLSQGPGNWLFVVSYNKSLQYLKKAATEQSKLAVYPAIRDAVEDDHASLRESRLALLNEAIDQLSPRKKEVFQLCRLEGKSAVEAARILGISHHTVKEYLQSSSEAIRSYIASSQAALPVLGAVFLSSYL
ncbi:RNA polymerase sigma factor [Chitinophaga eiseniae]|uniref:Sigma-70 family RNA polymerase sigma factor n=1 Tax=Chitinophaga eiseniae TaxID=634771 RepID=A0A847S5H3_9BACT|nr:sigma-70 family RNA polymerase sigma factor [Chitinophaga eiseniae]NLR77011.1 sigma-70 family RNA polymerase sigma factor [Chitinophaga eiseniae]